MKIESYKALFYFQEAFLRMGRLSEEKNGEIKNLKALVDEKNEELRV